jgi:ADP-ribose pyrophosphatase
MPSDIAITARRTVFQTPFFDLIAKSVSGQAGEPYYSIGTDDYVSVLCLTRHDEIPLVRQFRPAVEAWTVELPSGHVDKGETPEQAARRELLEETGLSATGWELLACLRPDTGRLGNHLWCYFASEATASDTVTEREPGLELILCQRSQWHEWLTPPTFSHGLHLAVLCLALMQGKLSLQEFRP